MLPRYELSAIHFFTEAFLAAPASALPSLLTAAVSQHFLMADVLAAPASGLPSLLVASFLHDPPCATAVLTLIGKNRAVAVAKQKNVVTVLSRVIIASSCAPAPASAVREAYDPHRRGQAPFLAPRIALSERLKG